jgi:hypothetical protein
VAASISEINLAILETMNESVIFETNKGHKQLVLYDMSERESAKTQNLRGKRNSAFVVLGLDAEVLSD